mgnify:CR=1 FL=1
MLEEVSKYNASNIYGIFADECVNFIFDSSRRKNSLKMAYLRQILTVFVLSRYYVIYCLCFVSLMIFLMLLFVMI